MEKIITGKEAVELIESAAAVIIMDSNQAVTYPSVEQPDDEEFWNVDINYQDEDGNSYESGFKIWGDDKIPVENNCLILTDCNSGEPTPVKILIEKVLEV